MTTQLTKPQFVKVKELERARSGYNVYVKVVSIQNSETQSKAPIVRAVVADQTGAANAFFKGDATALIQVGKVIAIRNGTIKYIKNKISLEVDIFGRITPETVEIKTTETTNNISDKEVERKPRRVDNRREGEQGERRPRREGDDRRPRRQGEDRRPRRQGDDRRPRREGEQGDRRPRREGDDRRPRRQGEDRRPRREGQDVERRPRREGDFDRRPRREGQEGDRRPRREGDDRRPRRQGDDRRPRREGDDGPRRDQNRGDRRPPVQFSKISAVEPGDEGLNFFAKVLSVEPVGKKARVVLGDQTAIIRAFLYLSDVIKEGESIVLFRAEAKVVKQHIQVQVPTGGRVDLARRKVENVNENFDVSAKEWVEADE